MAREAILNYSNLEKSEKVLNHAYVEDWRKIIEIETLLIGKILENTKN